MLTIWSKAWVLLKCETTADHVRELYKLTVQSWTMAWSFGSKQMSYWLIRLSLLASLFPPPWSLDLILPSTLERNCVDLEEIIWIIQTIWGPPWWWVMIGKGGQCEGRGGWGQGRQLNCTNTQVSYCSSTDARYPPITGTYEHLAV